MASSSGQLRHSLAGLGLPRTLLLLTLFGASAGSAPPVPHECLVLGSANGSTVSCYAAPEFPRSLPNDTIHLSVEFSNLTRLPTAALLRSPGLQELHLSTNHLQELDPDFLLPVGGLRVLDLTRNELRSLPTGLFRASLALSTLVLKENLLSNLSPSCLRGLTSLGLLDISGNRLNMLPPRLLAHLTSLNTLDLSDNQLETLPPDFLRGPARLHRLHLEGNRLRVLGVGLLAPQPALRYLFLGGNQLMTLEAGAFRGLEKLDMLDLSNNSLSSTPEGLWAPLGRPGRDMEDGVDVSHNPWICDRNLEDLRRWLAANSHKVFSANRTRCAGPKALRGRPLLQVPGRPA